MALHVDRHQRAHLAKQNAVLDTYRAYGRLAPGVLANRELVAARLAEGEQRRQLGLARTGPGPIRRWLAGRLISLGSRLGGVQAGFETGMANADEPVSARSTP